MKIARPRAAACSLASEDKEHRATETQGSPKKVELDRLLHVQDRERHEYAECDHFLNNLEFWQIEHRVANAIRGYLQQVFKERDGPTGDRGNKPRFRVEIFKMRIPSESHEDIRGNEEKHGFGDDRHGVILVRSLRS